MKDLLDVLEIFGGILLFGAIVGVGYKLCGIVGAIVVVVAIWFIITNIPNNKY